jgi:hypothetical protein
MSFCRRAPFGNDVPRVALIAAPAIVDRLRIVAVADVCPAADRACVKFHHVPFVAAARLPDLSLWAKHLFAGAVVTAASLRPAFCAKGSGH